VFSSRNKRSRRLFAPYLVVLSAECVLRKTLLASAILTFFDI
jgi:hypothetical protein